MPSSTYKATTYAAASRWLEDSAVKYKTNPKAGKSYHRYASYEKARTIGEALKLGSKPEDLLYDYEHGHLEVAEPLRTEPLDIFSVVNLDDLTYTDKILCRYLHYKDTMLQGNSEKLQWLEASINEAKKVRRRLHKIEVASALNIKNVDAIADTTGFWETPLMMGRRSVANEQAKDILDVAASLGREVTSYEVLEVLRLWGFRDNYTRQNVMNEGETFIYSDTLGLIPERTGRILAKEETHRYPSFSKLLCQWLLEQVPRELKGKVSFTSININKNYAARLHRDGNNIGPSFLKAFGDFKGGKLNYFPEDDKALDLNTLQNTLGDEKISIDACNGLLLFDGKRAHSVDPFEGERYSLVFFTCPRFWKASEETKNILVQAGFPNQSEEKVTVLRSMLRNPSGYKNKSVKLSDEKTPFIFWPHDDEETLRAESNAMTFWKKKGLREIDHDATSVLGRPVLEHTRHRRGALWSELLFVLPNEPTRKDLVLGFNNAPDAVDFLNDENSSIPQSILAEGCCAIFSNRTHVWYAIYQRKQKKKAMEVFGLDTELPKPKRQRTANE